MKSRFSYEEALEIINRLPTNAMILAALADKSLRNSDSLSEMKSFLKNYSVSKGNLAFLKAIHVAGSKGKGSTCAFTEKILRDRGLKTGLFTSPHLVHPRERIRINGLPVDRDTFTRHVFRLHDEIVRHGDMMSFFRFFWILAIDIFLEERIDVGIIEVGMGGRFDATNVIEDPIACGITSLAIEHVKILGPTIADIAMHKAGIMKPNVNVFSTLQAHQACTEVLIQEASKHSNCSLEFVPPIDSTCELGLSGDHQRDNSALALSLSSAWLQKCRPDLAPSSLDVLKSSLKFVEWPGRQQIIKLSPKLRLFLDGSHTFESISATAAWFKTNCSQGSRKILVFHCSTDRDYSLLLRPLLEISNLFERIVLTVPASASSNGKDTVESLAQHHSSMKQFWEKSSSKATCSTEHNLDWLEKVPTDLVNEVLVCGSLYLVGEFLKEFDIET